MSHVTRVDVDIKDLVALEAACKELGIKFIKDQSTYVWFGQFVGDAPVPEGFTRNELGHCSHIIKVPGERYEIGVVQKDGKWRLLYDAWNEKDYRQPNGIVQKLGAGLEKLKQMYGVHKTTIEARARGLIVNRTVLNNGAIRMMIGGRL